MILLETISTNKRKHIMNQLEQENHEDLRIIKDNIFQFSDFLNVDDISIQKIIYKLNNIPILDVALSHASRSLYEKFFRNLNDKMKKKLLHNSTIDSHTYTQDDIENAQQQIIKLAREMEKELQIELIQKNMRETKNEKV